DEVAPELERELQVLEVLTRQRWNRDRHAGEVHAFVRRDLAADDDAAARTTGLDLVDPQANHPVVDQHLMARPEHPADRSRGDRQLAVAGGAVSEHDRDLIALQQVERLVEAADAELRALQVA